MSNIPERLAAALEDRYRLARELGQGGMATVYLADDLKHKRHVALKVLKPELAAVLGAERFLHEITTTAALQHPHILPLFDSGEADGFLYYVMPFIDGETLRGKLNRETQLGVDEAIRITTDVADALHHAHSRGVIHRDIKPENILLANGRPMVADFGIALAVSAAAGGRMTETGLSLGTPHYMSPEQATAERDITARSDVYSLGSVLYEMLAGDPPHTGSSAQQIIMKIITEPAPLVTSARRSVPANVAAALAKALEKLPADRFASAQQFAEALANPSFTGGVAVSSAHMAPANARNTWRLVGVGVLGGLVLGVLGAWGLRNAGPRAVSASMGAGIGSGTFTRTQVSFSGRSRSPAISADGRSVAYAERRCGRGVNPRCSSALVTLERAGGRPITVLEDAVDIQGLRFSPDGQTLYFLAELDQSRRGIYAVPRLGGVPRRITGPALFDLHPSGDSLMVLVNRPAGERAIARIVVIATGAVADSMLLPPGPLTRPAWSPDGRWVVTSVPNTRLYVLRRNGALTDSVNGSYRATARWAPDDLSVLVFRGLNGTEDDLDRLQINADGKVTSQSVVMQRVQTALTGQFDVAHQSGTVAMLAGPSVFDIWTFDFAGHFEQRSFGSGWYGIPAISPDGRMVYYQRGDMIGDNLYATDADNREEQLTADPLIAFMNGVSVSRDGGHVAYNTITATGAEVGLMSLATRTARLEPARGNGTMDQLALSDGVGYPSGRGLIAVRGDSVVEWRVPDSLRLRSIAIGPGERTVSMVLDGRSATWVATSPLSEFQPTRVYTLSDDETVWRTLWSDDGWINLVMARANELPAVWGVRKSGDVPVRRAVLPPACGPANTALATSALQGACLALQSRPDVWVLDSLVPGR